MFILGTAKQEYNKVTDEEGRQRKMNVEEQKRARKKEDLAWYKVLLQSVMKRHYIYNIYTLPSLGEKSSYNKY